MPSEGLWSEGLRPLSRPSPFTPVKSDKLENLLNRHIKGEKFKDLSIPFQAVAVDITRGIPVILKSGDVAKAVRASCSIPGIFEPVKLDGRILVDGGVMNNVPADVVRNMGADLVLAVDLNSHQNITRPPANILDVLFYTFNIMVTNSRKQGLSKADIVITPDLKDLSFYNLNNLEEMIERGARAMEEKMPDLRKRLA
jgi:NTE family protein